MGCEQIFGFVLRPGLRGERPTRLQPHDAFKLAVLM